MKEDSHLVKEETHLLRRFGLLQATALNMSNMIGIGPFITIPLLMTALNGPQSMLGWFVALLICLADGLIWSELGAALPGSGGSYIYLRQAFGPQRWGRLMAFLFIWQFVFSGPLEIASGYIGFCQYLNYIWPTRTVLTLGVASHPLAIAIGPSPAVSSFEHSTVARIDPLAIAMGLVTIFLLYRRIGSIEKITIALCIGTLFTAAVVICLGA